jgi:hypothetical protein
MGSRCDANQSSGEELLAGYRGVDTPESEPRWGAIEKATLGGVRPNLQEYAAQAHNFSWERVQRELVERASRSSRSTDRRRSRPTSSPFASSIASTRRSI